MNTEITNLKDRANLWLTGRPPNNNPRILTYKWSLAKSYLSQYCQNGNNCVDGQLPADCTHFVCHALNHAGCRVDLPAVMCGGGLCVNARELYSSLKNSCDRYDNVNKIDLADTREGDIAVIPTKFGFDANHVFVLSKPAKKDGGYWWGHTFNRCGNTFLLWDDVSTTSDELEFFRIDSN